MKKLIIANWKCNPSSLKQARVLARASRGAVVCAPFVYIKDIGAKCSQDCFWEDRGAFTGEVSAKMLKGLGVKYVLVGHSERRNLFNETDEIINRKIKAILRHKLIPIFCIGETRKERMNGQTFSALEFQIKQGLKGVAKNKINSIIIAYEPVWAIGRGQACPVKDALTAILSIRKIISQSLGKKRAERILILYGGSVNSKNAPDYLGEKEINGLLIGGASLKPEEFKKIMRLNC